jgi:hypothetical protein
VADYTDPELLELLPVKELVRFLQPESTTVALNPRVTAPASFWIPDVRAVKDKPLSALEDAVTMTGALNKALQNSLETQRQKVEEHSIKLAEAEALRIEVTPLLSVCTGTLDRDGLLCG